MIRFLRWTDQGEISSESSTEIVRPVEGRRLWVDLVDESEEVIARQAEALGLDPNVASHLTDPSRTKDPEEHPGFVHVVLTGFVTGRGERMYTAEVDALIGHGYLITVHGGDLPTLNWAFERIAGGVLSPLMGPGGVLGYLALLGNRRLVSLLDELEEQTDALEELAFAADPRAVTEAQALQRDVLLLRRGLRSQLRVFGELAIADYPMLGDLDRQVFDRVVAGQSHSMDALDASLQLLGSLVETYRSAIADQTNEIVRVLTVFSAVLLPLGLLAGIWGMNFERIPGYTLAWGFWIPIAIMAAIAGGLWIYFSRRGFVGAPRLRELPKSVGLGLMQIGTAPIRAVAGGIESTIRSLTTTQQDEGPQSD